MGHGETTYFLESWGLPQNSTQRSGGDKKDFQIPHFTTKWLIPNNFSSICSKINSWPCWCWGPSWGWRCPQNSTQIMLGARKKFQITKLTMPNNFCFIKYALKSIPGLADVGVSHGVGEGPRSVPQCLMGPGKSFKWAILLCLTMLLPWNML